MADKGGNRDIYGREPDDGVQEVVGPALKDLGSSTSNSVNGKVNDSRDSEYEPEDGK